MSALSVISSETTPLRCDADVGHVQELVRDAAVSAKLSPADQAKIVTAASELARNTLTYGGGGAAVIETVTDGCRQGIRALFRDAGSGTADAGLALTDGTRAQVTKWAR